MAAILAISKGSESSYVRQMIVIGGFFFIFGFITWVNGTLIPYLKIACELRDWQAYLVTFAFYISYTVMALPSGRLLRYTGMIRGMQTGLVTMAAGCLLFVPAAFARNYGLFLLGLFVAGIGLTLLQTAVNPYITLLGPSDRAAQRISIMGICNKSAGILAPLILGAIILKNGDLLMKELRGLDPLARSVRLDKMAESVIMPYTLLAVLLVIVAFLLRFVHLPELALAVTDNKEISGHKTSRNQKMNLVLGSTAIFCTVGVEVIAGDTIGNYGLYQGLSLDTAKNLTAFTLTGMMIGYLFGAFAIPKIITQEKAFLISGLLGFALTLVAVLIPGATSIVFIALLGVANALLWPAIWPQALRGLQGSALTKGSAILIMGIAGGAILPLLYGWVAHHFNDQRAYWILIPCYLFDIFYWKMGRRSIQIAE